MKIFFFKCDLQIILIFIVTQFSCHSIQNYPFIGTSLTILIIKITFFFIVWNPPPLPVVIYKTKKRPPWLENSGSAVGFYNKSKGHVSHLAKNITIPLSCSIGNKRGNKQIKDHRSMEYMDQLQTEKIQGFIFFWVRMLSSLLQRESSLS